MIKLDESAIIKIFQGRLKAKRFVSEDVEIFNLGKTKIAVKTDTLVESTDIPSKMRLGDAARKSIVACVSDFAAKGVKPQYGVISVNLPKTITLSKTNEIARGFRRACDEYDISILGGDTNEGKEIVFNVCIFGRTDGIVGRRGARKGDLIFVTGPFGYTLAGLNMLLGKRKGEKRFVEKSIRALVSPKPRLKFGIKSKKYFSSSMDSSDGLSTTLNEMSKQSKKRFVIDNAPLRDDLQHYAESQKFDLERLVFHGGEEYEIVFTVSPEFRQKIKRNARLFGTPIIEIGYVTSGRGVFLKENNDYIRLKDLGWKHFR